MGINISNRKYDYAILYIMNAEDSLFIEWANFLKSRGLKDLALTLIEHAKPLTLLMSQFMYLGFAFVKPFGFSKHLNTMAFLLEDDQAIDTFIGYLEKGESLK